MKRVISALAISGVVCSAGASFAAPPTASIVIDEPAFYKASGYFPNIGVTLTRGYAPFAVFFEGWQSTPREEIVKWTWDFGAGTEGDELGRTFEGFNAAHVFETPGAYTVTLTVTNGANQTGQTTVSIEVIARNQTTYYVDSSIGNDNYDGKSQSVNGNAGPWKTADKAFHMLLKENGAPINAWPLKPGDRVLFKRGLTFDLTTILNAGHGRLCQGIQMGAYGDSAQTRPLLQWRGTYTAGVNPPSLFGEASGIGGAHLTFSDLRFNFLNQNSIDPTNPQQPFGNQLVGLVFAPSSWKNILFLRCDFAEPFNGVFLFHGGDLNSPNGIFMVSSSIEQPVTFSKAITFMYGGPSRLALLNNRFDQSGNHIAYLVSVNKAIIAKNIFSRPAFGRSALRIIGGPSPANPETMANNIHIIDNLFLGWIDPINGGGTGRSGDPHNGGGTRYNYGLINLSPGGNNAPLYLQDVIFERNTLTNFQGCISVGNMWNGILRNNLFITPSTEGSSALQLGQGAGALGNTRALKDVFVYGNTFLTNGDFPAIVAYPYTDPGPSNPAWDTADGQNENVQIKNNIIAAYASATGNALRMTGSTHGYDLDYNLYYRPGNTNGLLFNLSGTNHNLASWREATGFDAHSYNANPAFFGPIELPVHAPGEPASPEAGVNEADLYRAVLKLTAASPAVDQGVDPGARLHYDFENTIRPFGLGFDMGAFEFSSTGGDTAPPSVPGNLQAQRVTPTQVSLSWETSIDNAGGSGLAGYRIYRNHGQIAMASSAATSFADSAAPSHNAYTYYVTAVDKAANPSDPSNEVDVAAVPDAIKPSTPTNLTAYRVAGTARVNLSWTGSSDNVAVAGYRIYRNGSETPIGQTPGTSYADTSAATDRTFTYQVAAYDGSDNVSDLSETVEVAPSSSGRGENGDSGDGGGGGCFIDQVLPGRFLGAGWLVFGFGLGGSLWVWRKMI